MRKPIIYPPVAKSPCTCGHVKDRHKYSKEGYMLCSDCECTDFSYANKRHSVTWRKKHGIPL